MTVCVFSCAEAKREKQKIRKKYLSTPLFLRPAKNRSAFSKEEEKEKEKEKVPSAVLFPFSGEKFHDSTSLSVPEKRTTFSLSVPDKRTTSSLSVPDKRTTSSLSVPEKRTRWLDSSKTALMRNKRSLTRTVVSPDSLMAGLGSSKLVGP